MVSMLTIVCFGDLLHLWVNKVSVIFSQQLDLKNKNKTDYTELYRFGINGLTVVHYVL